MCTSDNDANDRVKCSQCVRSFCRDCHRPSIPDNIQGEPRGWACEFCVAARRTTATFNEIERAGENIETMERIAEGFDEGEYMV